MITLSTTESELLAILDGAIALRGVEAILCDVGEQIDSRCIESDSTSALSITTGASSWRTRHLRIKAGWLQEQLLDGHFQVSHCPGEIQPADLLTKALSSARMGHLLKLWGIGVHEQPKTSARTAPMVTSKMMVALLCCIMMVSVQATADQDDRGQPQQPSGLQLDYDSVGMLMILLMVLGAMMIWEGLRWVLIEAVTTWAPGASERKLRRLRKLQQATTEAIEHELNRLQSRENRDGVEGNTGTPTTTTPHPRVVSPQPTVEQPSSSSSGARVVQSVQPTDGEISRLLARARMVEEDSDALRRRQLQRRARTPSPRRESPAPMSSPSIPETGEDICRVAHDLCHLMTVESLKEGLRTEGLQVTGVKDSQAWRLGYRMAELSSQGVGPTTKQMKYVLWLYRVKDMKGRHILRYHEINDKGRISALIQAWKER